MDIIVGANNYYDTNTIYYPIYLKNNGSQSFEWIKMQVGIKFDGIYSMSALDLNNDGYIDMLSSGGFFSIMEAKLM